MDRLVSSREYDISRKRESWNNSMFLKCSASKHLVYFHCSSSLGRGCNDFSLNTRQKWFLQPCNLILFSIWNIGDSFINGGDCSRKSLQLFHAMSLCRNILAGGRGRQWNTYVYHLHIKDWASKKRLVLLPLVWASCPRRQTPSQTLLVSSNIANPLPYARAAHTFNDTDFFPIAEQISSRIIRVSLCRKLHGAILPIPFWPLHGSDRNSLDATTRPILNHKDRFTWREMHHTTLGILDSWKLHRTFLFYRYSGALQLAEVTRLGWYCYELFLSF